MLSLEALKAGYRAPPKEAMMAKPRACAIVDQGTIYGIHNPIIVVVPVRLFSIRSPLSKPTRNPIIPVKQASARSMPRIWFRLIPCDLNRPISLLRSVTVIIMIIAIPIVEINMAKYIMR
jgi:hypothetical protein